MTTNVRDTYQGHGVHQYGHSLDGPAAGVHSGGAKFKILYAIIVANLQIGAPTNAMGHSNVTML